MSGWNQRTTPAFSRQDAIDRHSLILACAHPLSTQACSHCCIITTEYLRCFTTLDARAWVYANTRLGPEERRTHSGEDQGCSLEQEPPSDAAPKLPLLGARWRIYPPVLVRFRGRCDCLLRESEIVYRQPTEVGGTTLHARQQTLHTIPLATWGG